jgi:glucokinase
MKEYAFAVDLGGTTVKMGLFRTEGVLMEKWEIPTRKENGGSQVLPDIAASLQEHGEKHGLKQEEFEGIGIGVPGPVKASGTVNKCVNLGWGVFNVADKLHELTGLRVKAANDANMAALGEQWMGGGKGHQNVIMVTLGTGVGGGEVVGGRIVSGAHGAGGEIGHLCVNPAETERCNCGRRGCLEQYASATGIVRVAKKRLAASNAPSALRDQVISAKSVFDCARAGDEVAERIVDDVCGTLGHALSQVALVTDPGVFVIGGGVSRAGSILRDTVERDYRETAFHAVADTEFALAELGNDAGIYGCIRLLLTEQ